MMPLSPLARVILDAFREHPDLIFTVEDLSEYLSLDEPLVEMGVEELVNVGLIRADGEFLSAR